MLIAPDQGGDVLALRVHQAHAATGVNAANDVNRPACAKQRRQVKGWQGEGQDVIVTASQCGMASIGFA